MPRRKEATHKERGVAQIPYIDPGFDRISIVSNVVSCATIVHEDRSRHIPCVLPRRTNFFLSAAAAAAGAVFVVAAVGVVGVVIVYNLWRTYRRAQSREFLCGYIWPHSSYEGQGGCSER